MENHKIGTGLSLDLIIHPGETLAEVIRDRNLSLKELANKTNLNENYLKSIINGENNITKALAKRLENTLNIEEQFWINLQNIYNKEMSEYKLFNNISKDNLNN